jgi:hypothetical protein
MSINKYTIGRLNLTLEGNSMMELTDMFLHFAEQGVFRELTIKEAEAMVKNKEITVEQICKLLMERVS